MRNMSFMLTTDQVRSRTKTVTRRVGWWNLKAGDVLQAVEKAQGLKKGEKVKPICHIRILSTRRESLSAMLNGGDYGFDETAKEGFKDHPRYQWPTEFVEWFAAGHGIEIHDDVNRIEFEYLETPQ